jgi:antitoxin (DNA-binding transcriptional repressor) of toxin-antitoxin stability system
VIVIVAGIRELKNRLSHFLRLVSGGEIVLVTDRGTVVAQLGPPPEVPARGRVPEEEALERLARLGRLRLGSGRIESATARQLPGPPARVDLERILAEVRSDPE